MNRSKIYKYLFLLGVLSLLIASIVYWRLPNRHKAIVKTLFLYNTGIIDNKWEVASDKQVYKMVSPDFYIDGIYKSMEGPKASNYVQLTQDSALVWITGFKVKAMNAKTKNQISNDFICHTNVDFNDASYYSKFNLNERIGKQYPRMTSLSHGQEQFQLPKGYGIPMIGNELLFVTTESLNHNIKDANYLIKHQVDIEYHKNSSPMKPLLSKTVFIMLPYDKADPFKSPLDPGANTCVPVETKNHSYTDAKGTCLSGHWVIPPGKKVYLSSIDEQLQLQDSLRLHAASVHVHPFSTSLTLFDKTTQTTIFRSKMVNAAGKIGLKSIDAFSSEKGIWLYKNHQYELIQEVNNTTTIDQDMMGSMFLFFYDEELDAKLKQK